jgi:16S rRNA (adenine1518-N6/adenine1519-N6)-dimethyltransferase
VDRRVVSRLIESFAPVPGEGVVEIGPGRGALTLPLAERGVRVVALEIDPRLAAELESMLAPHPCASVVRGDALEEDLDGLAARSTASAGKARLLGNLPYNVATAILRRVLAARRFRSAQIMVQSEVSDRLTATAGETAYGPLAVLCALRGGARRLYRIGPEAFRPRPRVVSAVVLVDLADDAPLPPQDVRALEGLLRVGFAERRKTLAKNLRRVGQPREIIASLLAELGLDPAVRAERVPPPLWLALRERLG